MGHLGWLALHLPTPHQPSSCLRHVAGMAQWGLVRAVSSPGLRGALMAPACGTGHPSSDAAIYTVIKHIFNSSPIPI